MLWHMVSGSGSVLVGQSSSFISRLNLFSLNKTDFGNVSVD